MSGLSLRANPAGRREIRDGVLCEKHRRLLRHATVYRDESGWSIRDRDATNGVILNCEQVPPGSRVPLTSGAAILLGDEELRFEVR